MITYYLDGAYHEVPESVDLPVSAVVVPRLPGDWEVWDGTQFVVSADADTALHALIDQTAEQIRGRFITAGSGQAMTYIRKEAEARAWLNDNDHPAPFLTAEASAVGVTISELATLIVQRADEWAQVGPMIEAARMAAKVAVVLAPDVPSKKAAALIDWESVISEQGQ